MTPSRHEAPLGRARDETEPEGGWEFDADVAAVFDDMLSRSIPQYDVMRDLVSELASSFVLGGGVVDLGASRGEALARVQARVDYKLAHYPVEERRTTDYFAVEVSQPMIEALEERWPDNDVLSTAPATNPTIIEADLREGWPVALGIEGVDVTLLILTLQFVPVEYRLRLLAEIHRRLRPGGAVILVEKVLGAGADVDRLFLETYYALKGENGYSPEQIERKKFSLEGVLVPVSTAMNEDLLRYAGFTQLDVFWRWANFAGFLAIK